MIFLSQVIVWDSIPDLSTHLLNSLRQHIFSSTSLPITISSHQHTLIIFKSRSYQSVSNLAEIDFLTIQIASWKNAKGDIGSEMA
jgi:hypothetical protein